MGFGTSGSSGLKGSREWSHGAQNARDHLQPVETPRGVTSHRCRTVLPVLQLLGALQLRLVVQSTGQKEKKIPSHSLGLAK